LQPGFRAHGRISPARTRNNRARSAACRCTNGRARATADQSSDSRSADCAASDVPPRAPAFATAYHLNVICGDVVAAAPDVNRLDRQHDAIAASRIRGSAKTDDFERRRRPAWDDDIAASVEQGVVNERRDPHAYERVPGRDRMVHSNVQHRPGRHDLGADRVSGAGTDRHRQADQDYAPTGHHTFTAPFLSRLPHVCSPPNLLFIQLCEI